MVVPLQLSSRLLVHSPGEQAGCNIGLPCLRSLWTSFPVTGAEALAGLEDPPTFFILYAGTSTQDVSYWVCPQARIGVDTATSGLSFTLRFSEYSPPVRRLDSRTTGHKLYSSMSMVAGVVLSTIVTGSLS